MHPVTRANMVTVAHQMRQNVNKELIAGSFLVLFGYSCQHKATRMLTIKRRVKGTVEMLCLEYKANPQ
jgi:hypothetical protein